jgi:AhpC/TSA antioxidant enzyme
VSYDTIRPLLREKGIALTLVSIGVPEKAALLQDHLDVQLPIYVDPTNRVYDALALRRGFDRTFANINTPLSFLDRWFGAPAGAGGTNKEDDHLATVMKKWSKAFYIPPEKHQAFLQGGTFIFRNNGQTVYAFYDPSTAAHPSRDRVLELATPPRQSL